LVFLSIRDYLNENKRYKRSQFTQKKIKQATQDKAKKCSLSLKGNPCQPARHHVFVGGQKFFLCQSHFEQHKRGEQLFDKPNFVKASDIE